MADALPRTPQRAAHEIVRLRFELFVQDQVRSAEFYKQAIGFEVEPSDRYPSSGYVQLINGEVCIGLCPVTSLAEGHYFRATTSGRPGVGVEIVFEVDDLLAYERRARLAGAIFEPLRYRPWGRRDFRVVDPDGYYIRVTESLREHRSRA